MKEFCQQVIDGRMAYIGNVRNDMKLLFNRPGMPMREWAKLHKKELTSAAIGKQAVVS